MIIVNETIVEAAQKPAREGKQKTLPFSKEQLEQCSETAASTRRRLVDWDSTRTELISWLDELMPPIMEKYWEQIFADYEILAVVDRVIVAIEHAHATLSDEGEWEMEVDAPRGVISLRYGRGWVMP